jgi:hypothetical protein
MWHWGRRNAFPHIVHFTFGFSSGRGYFPSSVPAHAFPHVFLRVACSFVRQGKISEQTPHTFQNGYTRFAFPCKVLRSDKYDLSISFNRAAMLGADDLVRAVRNNSVRGIAEVVLKALSDRHPFEGIILRRIAQCETPFACFTVVLPLAIN